MPMLRCPECKLPQYAARPYVTRAECVRCGRQLLQRRSGWGERASATPARPGGVEASRARSETRS